MSIQLNVGTGGEVLKTNNTGTHAQNVIVDSSALPTDAATQATLAAVLAKIIAAPSTEAKQDTLNTAIGLLAKLTETQPVSLASVPSHAVTGPLTDTQLRATAVPVSAASLPLPSGASTAANQTTLIAKDFATQTTLAAILAKILVAPATEAKQDTLNTAVGLLAKLTDTQPVSAASLPLPSGASTSANQTTLIAKDFATQTTLAAVLAKLIAAPATEAKQDTLNTAVGLLGTQTTSAAILAKIIASPATEAKQDTQNTSINTLLTNTQLRATPLSVIQIGRAHV